MPIHKHAYPILEYDTEPHGIIRPDRDGDAPLPAICVMTFFGEVLEAFVKTQNGIECGAYRSEMRDFPVYRLQYKGAELGVIQAAVGSASIALMTDYLFGNGVRTLIACGGCGVLQHIPAGDVILPTAALRDEGASYHYLPPSREIALDTDMVQLLQATLEAQHIPYITCKTWTTDGFYRETPDMVRYRKEEGCDTVEMECATMAAVARFRGVKFGQLLYSGDVLADADNYDERDWFANLSAREKLFALALDAGVQWAHEKA